MSQPYVGEIRMFGGGFAPQGWLFCDGSLLPIGPYETLFQLIGTTFGGDGASTFALPDLRGRLPIHMGSGFVIGEVSGIETVTLTTTQIPGHTHSVACGGPADSRSPRNAIPAAPRHEPAYAPGLTPVAMGSGLVASRGGSQPHTNLMPFLCVSFIIAFEGIFPSPS
jgi:microcystin-dependent protein